MAVLLSARPAAAYVRYTSNSGKTFAWPQSCVAMTVYPDDLTGMMTRDEILTAVDTSAATWSKTADACTYLNITMASSSDSDTPRGQRRPQQRHLPHEHLVQADGQGRLRSERPLRPGRARADVGVGQHVVRHHPRRRHRGERVQLQLGRPRVAPEFAGDGQSFHDLQNAVTHEMGHVIGLDHTCYLQGPAPLDSTGQPIPDCADAPPDVLATTMFPSANPGDIDKRDLAPDDQQAVCDIYPASHDPMTCAPGQTDPGGCSCSAAGAPASALASLVLLVLAVLGTRARRRRG